MLTYIFFGGLKQNSWYTKIFVEAYLLNYEQFEFI